MASIYDLKPAFQNLLRPLCQSLAARGVTANQVTVAAIVLSLFGGVAVAASSNNRWLLLVVPIVLFVRMALNAIDGMLAREHNMKSKTGAVLNEVGDVVSDIFLYLPFALLPQADWLLVVLVLMVSFLTEFAGVVIQALGGSRRYDGPFGKSDRAFGFGLIATLIAFNMGEASWIRTLLIVFLALSVFTVWRRCQRGLKECDND